MYAENATSVPPSATVLLLRASFSSGTPMRENAEPEEWRRGLAAPYFLLRAIEALGALKNHWHQKQERRKEPRRIRTAATN